MTGSSKQQFTYTPEAVEPEKAISPDAWTEHDHETYRLHPFRVAFSRNEV